MTPYTVQITRAARKELESLSKGIRERILEATEKLTDEPRPNGCKKLKGAMDKYRIRVGDYRVIYQIDDAIIRVLIVRVAHRKEAYD